jgi:glycine cleavage system T protein
MQKLALNEVHKSLGASFIDSSGWSVPGDYGDKMSEYKAVRENVGIADLSSRGELRLSGKDHLKFLQGMLSNDLMILEEGKGMYATILTVKGRMISDMRVYKDKEPVFLDLEPGMNEIVSELLTKFRLSYKATIDDLTETLGLISVQGPDSKKLLELLLEVEIPPMNEYDFSKKDFRGSEIFLVYVNRTGEKGFDIYIENKNIQYLWEELMKHGEALNIKPIGYHTLNTLRIEAGIPVYNLDMDENNIPIEAGLWSALNFEKGCYVGQEVIARIKWRGHVNWHLLGFVIIGDQLAEVGDEIYSGEKKIGRVTSSAFSHKLNKPVCLGYIRREFKEPGNIVSINGTDHPEFQAEVTRLPFYRGSF